MTAPLARPGPGSVVPVHLWRLEAEPALVAGAAADWRELARGLDRTGQEIAVASQTLLDAWDGASAAAYRGRRDRALDAVATVGAVAGQIAASLDEAAGVLAATQEHLDRSWSRLRADVGPAGVLALAGQSPDAAALGPVDPAAGRVALAAAEAAEIRTLADRRLAAIADAVHRLRWHLWPAATALAREEAAGAPAEPELASAGRVIVEGNRAIINGSGGNDDIRVAVDHATGEHLVTVGGVVRRFPPGVDLVVRAGSGNDTITVAPGNRVRVTLLGGAGDDRIVGGAGEETVLGLWGRDTIDAGGGSDWVSGGAGGDYLDGQGGDDVLVGGPGEDTLYGLAGADLLWGGLDRDYLDGGGGDDRLAGGSAADVVVGGRGADTLRGGCGDDVLYGGQGTDRILGGSGADRVYHQLDDAVSGAERTVTVQLTDAGGFIRVEGSADFVARVQSDLDALRSSPSGVLMLDALQRAHAESRSAVADVPVLGLLFGRGDTLTIRELDLANGFANWRSFGGQGHATVDYNPRFDDFWLGPPAPPVVVLYHELAHVYDYVNETLADGIYTGADNPGVPNRERVATGLPIDHDGDPATPLRIDPSHPVELTENGLRAELGRPLRPRY